MKTFAKTSILIIAIMAFVGGIAHAATLNGVVPQTITTGDTMGRGWYQDINNRLPPTGGTP